MLLQIERNEMKQVLWFYDLTKVRRNTLCSNSQRPKLDGTRCVLLLSDRKKKEHLYATTELQVLHLIC